MIFIKNSLIKFFSKLFSNSNRGIDLNSDTVKWFNLSCAILTEYQNEDFNIFGGIEKNEANKIKKLKLLDEAWDIKDEAKASSTIKWLVDKGGLRVEFTEIMTNLEFKGFSHCSEEEKLNVLIEVYELEHIEAVSIVKCYEYYLKYGRKAIDAWDYSRAMSLLGMYYIADIYTLRETLNLAYSMAKQIQSKYSNWEEFFESYIMGFEYCYKKDDKVIREIYERIKKHENFNIDFKLKLERTW